MAAAARAADGQPQVVLVGGEAGVGKSRLVEHVVSAAAAEGWRVLLGSSLTPGTETLPLAPFITALRRMTKDINIEDAVTAFPKDLEFERLLPEWYGDQPEDEIRRNRSLFQSFIFLLEELSAERSLLLVLEDIHDADPETYKLFDFLARSLDKSHMLIVATYRTDDVSRGHPLQPLLSEWQRGKNVRYLELERFSRTETAKLIQSILGYRPAEALLARIFDRSGGNAFFIEQLTRVEQTGRTGNLPDSLRDLLLDRIERLPQSAQKVANFIALGGPSVSHRLLAAAADIPENELLAALRTAVDAHVLTTSDDGYGFQHALVRETAIDTLLPGERIQIHHTYANVLDKQPDLIAAERHAACTAYHWLGAQRPDRAFPELLKAATVAERFRAHVEQHRLLTRALEVWPNVPNPEVSLLDLLSTAAYAAFRAVAHNHAHRLIEQALDEANLAGDENRMATLLALRSRILLRQGGKGALLAAQAANRLALPQHSASRARVLEVLASALTSDGQPDKALPIGQKAIRLAIDLGDEELQINALSTVGLALGHLGRHERAVAVHKQAEEIAKRCRDMEGLTRVCINLSLELWAYGRHEEAIAEASMGVHAARRAGLARAQGMHATSNLAYALFAIGCWDDAEQVVTEALEARPNDVYLAYPHMILAELAIGRGDLTAAREHYAVASAALLVRLERHEGSLPMARLTAEIALMEHRYEDARWAVEAVLDAAQVRGQVVSHAWPLLATAARIEVQAQAHGVPPGNLEKLRRIAAGLSQRAPSWRAWALQFAAELDSLHKPSPAWAGVVTAWEKTIELYPTCYTRLRAAEAAILGGDNGRARQWLAAAADEADRLGAAPLSREIDLLSTGARLNLHGLTKPLPPSLAAGPGAGLTRRETEVLLLLAEGLSNKAIAERLVITEKTASVHVSRILGKLHVGNRTHAVITARRRGLVPSPDGN